MSQEQADVHLKLQALEKRYNELFARTSILMKLQSKS